MSILFLYCEENDIGRKIVKKELSLCVSNGEVGIIHNHSKTVKANVKKEKCIKSSWIALSTI